jgi:adenylyltransferase/sulfurtransferase
MLTVDEQERYDRQIMIPEIGEAGQEKLKQARVLIAGAGGLGSPVAFYLAAAGVGTLRIVDHDRVALSNLNRQILHWDSDRGLKKVDSACEKLESLNPKIHVEGMCETIVEGNARELVHGVDMLVDAMDNLSTRFVLNKAALECRIPYFHGAVSGFEGRAMTIIPGKTACLKCVSRGPVPEEKFPVIGVTPAVIGSIQATEVIKFIIGRGDLLTNCLLHYDGLTNEFVKFRLRRNPRCEHCGPMEGKE